MSLPTAKLPNVKTPRIRRIPSLPGGVGCAGGNPHTYAGAQFGNLPDVSALLHLRHLRKILDDHIGALVDGYLPTLARKPKYAARVLTLTQQVQQIVSAMAQVTSQLQGEYSAQLDYVNRHIGRVNESVAAWQSLPEAARSRLQNHLLRRYNEYVADLNEQAARIQQALRCLG